MLFPSATKGSLSTQLAACGAASYFWGMVEHVDKHASTCRVYLRKRPVLVPRSGLLTDICHHLKLITVFV